MATIRPGRTAAPAREGLAERRFGGVADPAGNFLNAAVGLAKQAAGHAHETITVPGALELPGAISLAAESGRYDAFVALGVVIRGETWPFEIVAGESARGLMALTMDGIAVGNGILTVENEAQAIVRADSAQADKGGDAAKAALALLSLQSSLRA